jgi:deoxycytidylate deaminase
MPQCLKQTTIAVIMKDGKFIDIGNNSIRNKEIKVCPREGMKTGEGYEKCKDICKQVNHAEVDACNHARGRAHGGTLYLIGHSYACNNCIEIMKKYGIKELVICETGKIIKLLATTKEQLCL